MDNTTLPVSIREQWPWQPRFARTNGWRMHYVDEGTGDPVVLLHGNPTWGFLYRDFVEPLMRAGHRVVIPDMIGFGLSEKPTREEAHSLDGHIANLTALLRQLDLRRITLVCHDWGGPTGLGFAFSNPSRVAALVGRYLLGRHNALAGRGVYLSVVDREKFRKRGQQAYEWAVPDPAARLLTWTWPRWIPLDATARALDRFSWLERELAACRLPTMIVWGRDDDVFGRATFAARFKQLLPHAEGPSLVTGRHFLQEDSGPEIAALVTDFLARNRTDD